MPSLPSHAQPSFNRSKAEPHKSINFDSGVAAMDFTKAAKITESTFKPVQHYILKLAGLCFDDDEGPWPTNMTRYEKMAFDDILENICNHPEYKNASIVGTMKKFKVRCEDSMDKRIVVLVDTDLAKYQALILGLHPLEFFKVAEVRWVRLWWMNNYRAHGGWDIGEYAKDLSTMVLLHDLDAYLRGRVRVRAEAGGAIWIVSNSAPMILLRVGDFMRKHDRLHEDFANMVSALITVLKNVEDYAYVFLDDQQVKILDRIYDESSGELQLISSSTTQREQSKYGTCLFNLELSIAVWAEHMLDATEVILCDLSLSPMETGTRMQAVMHSLLESVSPFMPKAHIFKIFSSRFPLMPPDPWSLEPTHRHCAEKVKKLQERVDEWEQWAAEDALPGLGGALSTEQTLGKTKLEIMTSAIAVLSNAFNDDWEVIKEKDLEIQKLGTELAKREDYRKKNNELCAEAEKREVNDRKKYSVLRADAAKREVADQKKINELRAEIRTKDAKVSKLQQELDEKREWKKSPSVSDLEQQKEQVKADARRLRDRQEELKAQEEKFKSLQRKNNKDFQKESKLTEARLTVQLNAEQAKALDLEKKLANSSKSLKILTLDYDATLAQLQEIKDAETLRKSKAGQESDQEAKFKKLQDELERYKGLYHATRSSEQIVQDRISRAVKEVEDRKEAVFFKALGEKEEELVAARADLVTAQRNAESKSIEDEEKMLAALATRDEIIEDLSITKRGLQQKIADNEYELRALTRRMATLAAVSQSDTQLPGGQQNGTWSDQLASQPFPVPPQLYDPGQNNYYSGLPQYFEQSNYNGYLYNYNQGPLHPQPATFQLAQHPPQSTTFRGQHSSGRRRGGRGRRGLGVEKMGITKDEH